MSACLIRRVRSVELIATNLDEASRFYETVWNLTPVETRNDARYFRGTSRFHHVLGLQEGTRPAVRRIVFDVADRAGVDTLHRQVGYRPQPSDYWKFKPGRSDQWGITQPRSARYYRVQRLFHFTADGDRLS